MVTKIEAAKIAVDAGIPCVIANGRKEGIISSVINEPQGHGTLFVNKKALRERERWIAFGTKPKGKITIDEGAKHALLNRKSLLSVGITALEGSFDKGDIISIIDKHGREIARGKVGLSRKQLDKVKGIRFGKEAVHCDNIVVLAMDY
jgi:glutamate 5-kinase